MLICHVTIMDRMITLQHTWEVMSEVEQIMYSPHHLWWGFEH